MDISETSPSKPVGMTEEEKRDVREWLVGTGATADKVEAFITNLESDLKVMWRVFKIFQNLPDHSSVTGRKKKILNALENVIKQTELLFQESLSPEFRELKVSPIPVLNFDIEELSPKNRQGKDKKQLMYRWYIHHASKEYAVKWSPLYRIRENLQAELLLEIKPGHRAKPYPGFNQEFVSAIARNFASCIGQPSFYVDGAFYNIVKLSFKHLGLPCKTPDRSIKAALKALKSK